MSVKRDDWDESIDYVTFAYNTKRQSTIGMSPFRAFYGREPTLNVDVVVGKNLIV